MAAIIIFFAILDYVYTTLNRSENGATKKYSKTELCLHCTRADFFENVTFAQRGVVRVNAVSRYTYTF